jgi:hypothetical protein
LQREFKIKACSSLEFVQTIPDYPDDSPANLLKRWRDKDYQFPYLIDETQQAAKDLRRFVPRTFMCLMNAGNWLITDGLMITGVRRTGDPAGSCGSHQDSFSWKIARICASTLYGLLD